MGGHIEPKEDQEEDWWTTSVYVSVQSSTQ